MLVGYHYDASFILGYRVKDCTAATLKDTRENLYFMDNECLIDLVNAPENVI